MGILPQGLGCEYTDEDLDNAFQADNPGAAALPPREGAARRLSQQMPGVYAFRRLFPALWELEAALPADGAAALGPGSWTHVATPAFAAHSSVTANSAAAVTAHAALAAAISAAPPALSSTPAVLRAAMRLGTAVRDAAADPPPAGVDAAEPLLLQRAHDAAAALEAAITAAAPAEAPPAAPSQPPPLVSGEEPPQLGGAAPLGDAVDAQPQQQLRAAAADVAAVVATGSYSGVSAQISLLARLVDRFRAPVPPAPADAAGRSAALPAGPAPQSAAPSPAAAAASSGGGSSRRGGLTLTFAPSVGSSAGGGGGPNAPQSAAPSHRPPPPSVGGAGAAASAHGAAASDLQSQSQQSQQQLDAGTAALLSAPASDVASATLASLFAARYTPAMGRALLAGADRSGLLGLTEALLVQAPWRRAFVALAEASYAPHPPAAAAGAGTGNAAAAPAAEVAHNDELMVLLVHAIARGEHVRDVAGSPLVAGMLECSTRLVADVLASRVAAAGGGGGGAPKADAATDARLLCVNEYTALLAVAATGAALQLADTSGSGCSPPADGGDATPGGDDGAPTAATAAALLRLARFKQELGYALLSNSAAAGSGAVAAVATAATTAPSGAAAAPAAGSALLGPGEGPLARALTVAPAFARLVCGVPSGEDGAAAAGAGAGPPSTSVALPGVYDAVSALRCVALRYWCAPPDGSVGATSAAAAPLTLTLADDLFPDEGLPALLAAGDAAASAIAARARAAAESRTAEAASMSAAEAARGLGGLGADAGAAWELASDEEQARVSALLARPVSVADAAGVLSALRQLSGSYQLFDPSLGSRLLGQRSQLGAALGQLAALQHELAEGGDAGGADAEQLAAAVAQYAGEMQGVEALLEAHTFTARVLRQPDVCALLLHLLFHPSIQLGAAPSPSSASGPGAAAAAARGDDDDPSAQPARLLAGALAWALGQVGQPTLLQRLADDSEEAPADEAPAEAPAAAAAAAASRKRKRPAFEGPDAASNVTDACLSAAALAGGCGGGGGGSLPPPQRLPRDGADGRLEEATGGGAWVTALGDALLTASGCLKPGGALGHPSAFGLTTAALRSAGGLADASASVCAALRALAVAGCAFAPVAVGTLHALRHGLAAPSLLDDPRFTDAVGAIVRTALLLGDAHGPSLAPPVLALLAQALRLAPRVVDAAPLAAFRGSLADALAELVVAGGPLALPTLAHVRAAAPSWDVALARRFLTRLLPALAGPYSLALALEVTRLVAHVQGRLVASRAAALAAGGHASSSASAASVVEGGAGAPAALALRAFLSDPRVSVAMAVKALQGAAGAAAAARLGAGEQAGELLALLLRIEAAYTQTGVL